MALDVWNWLRGCPDAPPSDPVQKDAARLLEELQEGAEALRLHAAFALGSRGAGVVPQILEALRREAREVVDRIEAKTADNAHGTNPTACRAAQALVAVGAVGVPQVIAALADEHWLVRAALVDRGVMVVPDFDADLPAIVADRIQIQQVVLNLINNAMQAMEGQDDARLVLGVRGREDGWQVVAVSDSGPGILPSRLCTLFEPFETSRADGLGMGLSISRTIVEAHGGEIEAENLRGGGARVQFALPPGRLAP